MELIRDLMNAHIDRMKSQGDSLVAVEGSSKQRHDVTNKRVETLEDRLSFLTKKIVDGDMGGGSD